MPLDWTAFESLPGDSRINFENLCRGIARLHWGQFGQLHALKNQPGVEFHLKLDKDSSALGKAGRWYGWQCKKFTRNKDGSLNAESKKDIQDSLTKTEKYLPDLTDWVLWTPFTLSAADQAWFKGLKSKYTLHLWTETEVDNNLSGPALHVRGAYFGELVVTPDMLQRQHELSIAPIKERWMHPAHQETDVERTLRRMLGEQTSWDDLANLGKALSDTATIVDEFVDVPPELEADKIEFSSSCRDASEKLLNFHTLLADGDFDILQQWLAKRDSLLKAKSRKFVSVLRKMNLSLALEATNALDDMKQAVAAFSEIASYLSIGMVAVIADAGGGKTHLSAQITAPQESGRPAGVLLHGKSFHKGQNQNDLARHFSINRTPVDSMEKLLASVDAAGKRSRCRLPIVIDGLNEAENPKEWKAILAAIQAISADYPNTLIICTLRTGEHGRNNYHNSETRETFAVQALPADIVKIESEGFEEDLFPALEKYFDYYRISADAGTEVPVGFLNHPLNMRIFCDCINPKRLNDVHIDYFPSSLSNLFEAYVGNACARIAEMPNTPYTRLNIEDALYKLGIDLWNSNSRDIDDASFVNQIHPVAPEWKLNIVNLLSQEGIIFRNPSETPAAYIITPVYDALGGHIIASALLKKEVNDRDFKWLSTAISKGKFRGETSHALSHDIFKALVALVPSRMHNEQLWKKVPNEYKDKALLLAIELDAKYLDKETVEQIADLVKNPQHRQKLFARLWGETKGAIGHPLNADFLDKILRSLPMNERDLSWTEWLRRGKEYYDGHLIKEISQLEERWKENIEPRSASDCLRAKALSWALTSTSHSLRDTATRTLYWFGRGKPEALFDLTIKALSINDPYVPERLLAASYGVAMALNKSISSGSTVPEGTLTKFAGELFKYMFSSAAEYKTTHLFSRDFAARIIELAQYQNPNFFSDEEIKKTIPPYTTDGLPVWGEAYIEEGAKISARGKPASPLSRFIDKAKYRLVKALPKKIEDAYWKKRAHTLNQSPFKMDFENYTIGRLVQGRHNYDYDHLEYSKVKAQILWRVFQLGWSYDRFKAAEESIVSDQNFNRYDRRESSKIDRYGKKYSWIAYYEMAGFLGDKGLLDEERDWWRVAAENIDPSFMPKIETSPLIADGFLGDENQSAQDWIKQGKIPDVTHYLKLEKNEGNWVMLDAHVNQEDKKQRKDTFFFVRSFLVATEDVEKILPLLKDKHERDSHIPEKPDLYNVYWMEVPWSSTFKDHSDVEWSIIVNERKTTKKVQLPPFITDKDGKFTITENPGFEEKEITEYDYAKFKTIIPVCDIRSDVAQEGSQSIPTLSKKLSIEMDLIGKPQSTDLFSKNGKQATFYASFKPDEHRNSHAAFYVREDLLQKFLKQHKLALIWIVWGERRYALRDDYSLDEKMPEPRYALFRDVQVYDY